MSHPRVKTLTRRVTLLLALLLCFASAASAPSGEAGVGDATVAMAPPCSLAPERPDCIEDRPPCPFPDTVCPLTPPGGALLAH